MNPYKREQLLRNSGLASFIAILFLLISTYANAAVVITVDTTSDDFTNNGNCTLQEAIAAANNNTTFDNCVHDGSGGMDEIQFNLSYPATITLTQLAVLEPVTITGPGADKLFLNANYQSRIFDFGFVTSAKVTGISFVQGRVHGLIPGADAKGGAIYDSADSLEIDHCAFFFNEANGADGSDPGQGGGAGIGGALYVDPGKSVIIKNSYFASNFANGGNGADDVTQGGSGGYAFGGAIYSLGPVTLINTTVSQNGSFGGDGGNGATTGDAGWASAVIDAADNLSLTHATIYFNEAQAGSGPGGLRFGGGINLNSGVELQFQYSIIAGNTGPVSSPDIWDPITATATSLGHNVVGITDITPTTGDIFGTTQSPVDPLLNTLADNGGGTYTHSLKDGSPALDIDTNANCAVAADQRGVTRPQGSGCDAGAFEREVQAPVFKCPHSQGFWKTNKNSWPVAILTLGTQQYTKAELLVILGLTTKKDASVILAKQMIAAKLSIAAGSDPAPINAQITQADTLLSGFAGKLPYQVKTNSNIGNQMTSLALILEQYDLKQLTPSCQP